MGKGLLGNAWFKQPAVAVAYALTYLAIHPFSDAHWSLASGLRLTCLLLIPYRYWLALAIGEAVPLIYCLWPCLPQFGAATVAIWSFPPIVVAMPVVWYCRRHLRLFPQRHVIDMKALLLCVLSTSLLWTAITCLGLYLEAEPQRTLDRVAPIMIPGLLVGEYVAVLTVATWPLLLKIARLEKSWKAALQSALTSRLAADAALIALPTLALIAFVSAHVDVQIRTIVQMALFMPVAWLTLKYGWRGTALCSPLAVACICMLTQSAPDPAIIQTQAWVAFAITFLFLTGARIASQIYAEEAERLAVKNALRVAQQCLHQGELRLRQTAQALELVGGAVSITQNRVIDRVRQMLTVDEHERITRQISASTHQIYRLAESIHPVAWRARGVQAALQDVIGAALDEAGIAYQCDVQGRGLSQLAPTVHQAIYRMACEAVVAACNELTCNSVRLTLRGGYTNGRRWAVLRVVGIGGRLNLENIAFRSRPRHSLGSKLNTSTSGEAAIKEQAALFDGIVHTRRNNDVVVLTALLHDAQHLELGEHLAPVKLWVH